MYAGRRRAPRNAISRTDDDAAAARKSAVDCGYLDDPFARFFAPAGATRRFPIINRGTYVRTTAIDRLVHDFLRDQTAQIVSLGAGTDTRFWRLLQHGPPSWIYHEFDLSDNATRKVSTITAHAELLDMIPGPVVLASEPGEPLLSSPHYHIHAADLRTLTGPFSSIDPNLPTMILSECCLVYLQPNEADEVVRFFLSLLSPNVPHSLVIYEPTDVDDAFGQVMTSNLASRGILLPTLSKYGSVNAQEARLQAYGFPHCQARKIQDIWDQDVLEEEKARIARLQMVDEVEEWNLLAAHYCLIHGCVKHEL